MAAHLRPGDRTFFIYDHSVLKKEADDPKDAIIYYFPQHTSVDIQCTFCSQLMGMVGCTRAIGGAPPKLYKLRKLKVATVHEGNFTLALACKLRTPDAAIIQKLENLYKVFAFYHCSIKRVQELSSNNEAFLSNMAAIWDFYVPYVRRYGNTVPAMFEPIQKVKLLKGGNVFFLRCSHLLQWLKGQPSLLAGCILYKQSVLCTQLTPELTSHLLLIKPNQLHHPSKSVTDTVLPFGVRIMSVFVTQQQYQQLSLPLEPLLKPRPSPVPTKQPEGFFCTPPASPTEKLSSKDQLSPNNQSSPKRTLERRINSKLFSNFTGMLEGNVVESLWPSKSKSSRSSSRSESPWDDSKRNSLKAGSPSFMQGGDAAVTLSRSSDDVVRALQSDGDSPERALTRIAPSDVQIDAKRGSWKRGSPSLMKDTGYEVVMLSKSSDDVVKALQDDGGSPVREATGSRPCGAQMTSAYPGVEEVLDFNRKPFNCPDLSIEPQSSEGLSEAIPVKHGMASTQAQNETGLRYAGMDLPPKTSCFDDAQQGFAEERRLRDSVSETEVQTEMSSEQKVYVENIDGSRLQTGVEVIDSVSDCSRRKGLGGQMISKSTNPSESLKANLSDQKSESPESGIGDCLVETRHKDFSGKDYGTGVKDNGFVEAEGFGQYNSHVTSDGGHCCCSVEYQDGSDNTDVKIEEDAQNTINAMSDQCLCNDDCKNENASLLISDKVDDSTLMLDSVHTNNEKNSFVEETSSSVEESIEAQDLLLGASQLNGDVLRSAEDEPRDGPQLSEPSRLLESPAEGETGGNLEGVNKNVECETEQHPSASSPECKRKDTVDDIGGQDEMKDSKLLEEEEHSDEEERTVLAEDDGKSDKEAPSSACESRNRLSIDPDTEVQVPQTQEEDNSEISQDLSETSERPQSLADVQSLEEEPVKVLDLKESKIDTPEELKDAGQEGILDSPEGLTRGNTIEIDLNTSSSSATVTRDEDASLRENVDEELGSVRDEYDDARLEDDEETSDVFGAERRSSHEDSSLLEHENEPIPDLVNVSLYVQAHSDTTLLFLAEKSITKEKETLYQLWQSVLRELGELELQLKNVVKPEHDLDCRGAYNLLHFDNEQMVLEESISNPVNQAESVFCRETQHIHQQFLSDETLTDVTLRNRQTVIYAHRNACQHTFYHKNYKPTPTPGIPSRDDAAFYIQSSCKDALREHNINLL